MPLSEIAKYSGIQREYAICLRQIQIMLYKAPEPDRPHYVSYRTLLKNYELLCYLHNNNIHSVGELKSVVDKAEGKYSEVLTAKKKLEDRISEEEKIIGDFPKFTELVNKNPMTKSEREELKKLSYLADKGVLSNDDVTEHKQQLEQLKNIEVVRYDQFSPLDKPEKVAYIVTDEEAQELSKVAKLGDLDIQFAKTEQGTAVLYNSDIAEKIAETREDYAKAVSESEAFLIDVTDNTISISNHRFEIGRRTECQWENTVNSVLFPIFAKKIILNR